MAEYVARRERRRTLAVPDRLDLIDDDLDENNRSHTRLRADQEALATRVETKLEAISGRLTTMLVSLVTGAVLLAINIFVMRSQP